MLCSICENIQYDDLDQERNDTGYPGHPHHRNFAELQSCLDCDFCRVVTADIALNQALKVQSQWQEQHIYLRVIPSSTAIDESNKSNLLVYCSPWQENGRDQTTLAFYGIFVEKTQTEMKQLKP